MTWARVKDVVALSKPRITFMVAACAAAGYAAAPGPRPGWSTLLWTLGGVALAAASTGCLNQCLEALPDSRMRRTRDRPVPAGRLDGAAAVMIGVAWGAAGLWMLAARVNGAACALTAFTLASYLAIYTPMKRTTSASTWVGAVPGALPPVIGWAAAGGRMDAGAAALFAIQLLWQLPHFYALAWLYREDYARAGFRVLPVIEPDGASTARRMSVSAALLMPVSALPFVLGMSGPYYLAGGLALGAWFYGRSAAAARTMEDAAVKRAFTASLAYLPLVLGLLALDRPR